MIDRHFDEELKELKSDLLKIAAMTEEAIHRSIEALKARDKEAALGVISDDEKIDQLELKIDEQVVDLLARRQPIAADLRFLLTAMKINTQLERIADLAVNIAQRVVLELADQPRIKLQGDIPKLAAIAQKTVRQTIDAFVNHDEALAKEVILADEEADELRNAIQRELIDEYIVKDPALAPRAVALLLVARHFERICDHATNIAEDVIYMVHAEVVKHRPERLENDGQG